MQQHESFKGMLSKSLGHCPLVWVPSLPLPLTLAFQPSFQCFPRNSHKHFCSQCELHIKVNISFWKLQNIKCHLVQWWSCISTAGLGMKRKEERKPSDTVPIASAWLHQFGKPYSSQPSVYSILKYSPEKPWKQAGIAPVVQNHAHKTGVTMFHSGKSSKAFILIILWDDCTQGLPPFLSSLSAALSSGLEIILVSPIWRSDISLCVSLSSPMSHSLAAGSLELLSANLKRKSHIVIFIWMQYYWLSMVCFHFFYCEIHLLLLL